MVHSYSLPQGRAPIQSGGRGFWGGGSGLTAHAWRMIRKVKESSTCSIPRARSSLASWPLT